MALVGQLKSLSLRMGGGENDKACALRSLRDNVDRKKELLVQL